MKLNYVIKVIAVLLCVVNIHCSMFDNNNGKYIIETSDIERFWQAYDGLKLVHTFDDSVAVIQNQYLDRMSSYGEKFIDIRRYTAPEFVRTIRKYPKYLTGLRIKTTQLISHKAELDSTFNKLSKAIPGYRKPNVCFAIGCFRGGGTTKKNVILIGSEIALADSTMDCSEFRGFLHDYLSTSDGKIAGLVAHESIHCQQHNWQKQTLLSVALHEGVADFLPALVLHTNINGLTYKYGLMHECDLWNEFQKDVDKTDLSRWLFNTRESKDRPGDLGYFMGSRICESYYNSQPDKNKAISDLLDGSKHQEVLQQSGYNGNCK